MGEYDGIINIKYKVERAGEMPILEDIWTTPANLQIKGNCSLLQSCLLCCWIIPKKIYPEPTIFIPDPMSFWNSTDCRRAEIPSAGGLASARCWTTWPLIETVQKTLPSCFGHLALSGIRHIGCLFCEVFMPDICQFGSPPHYKACKKCTKKRLNERQNSQNGP